MPSSLALPLQRDNELLPMHHRKSGGPSPIPRRRVVRLHPVDANTDYAAVDPREETKWFASPLDIVYTRVSRQHPPLPTSLIGYGPDSRLSSQQTHLTKPSQGDPLTDKTPPLDSNPVSMVPLSTMVTSALNTCCGASSTPPTFASNSTSALDNTLNTPNLALPASRLWSDSDIAAELAAALSGELIALQMPYLQLTILKAKSAPRFPT
ncbi:hypothetical protein R3P38DRAFT_3199211 [Favolaschia claudopus]|uniref:Uncharacterized protein n=1 Tax=Favolaschia claudopus TaxID=2862362 RepID=A0AAW0B468_9AGAR